MPEYSVTTTGNFHYSRLGIIFFVIDYYPEIEATFIYWGDGRVVHTKADKLIIRLVFIALPHIVGEPVPY